MRARGGKKKGEIGLGEKYIPWETSDFPRTRITAPPNGPKTRRRIEKSCLVKRPRRGREISFLSDLFAFRRASSACRTREFDSSSPTSGRNRPTLYTCTWLLARGGLGGRRRLHAHVAADVRGKRHEEEIRCLMEKNL